MQAKKNVFEKAGILSEDHREIKILAATMGVKFYEVVGLAVKALKKSLKKEVKS